MKLTFSQDNQTTSGIWDNVKGGICNKVFVTLKLDLGKLVRINDYTKIKDYTK